MLLLTSTSDVINLVTGSAIAIDVHCSWVDYSAGSVTPGRTNTAISTATTTAIVGSPAASTQRNVKTINITNKGASSDVVTVNHYDGTTTIQLYKVTLNAGQSIQYIDELGWIFAPLGQLVNTFGSSASPTGNVSTTEKAMGLGGVAGFTLTPNVTGKVYCEFNGIAMNSTSAGDGTNITPRYGTGTAPINGATSGLGTSFGLTQHFVASTTAGQQGFAVQGQITGLTIGTAVWFDLSLLAVTGGGSTIKDVTMYAFETY